MCKNKQLNYIKCSNNNSAAVHILRKNLIFTEKCKVSLKKGKKDIKRTKMRKNIQK